MSWQERMQKSDEDSARLAGILASQKEDDADKEQKRREDLVTKKSPELFSVLSKLDLENTFVLIRDDLWKFGDIYKTSFFTDRKYPESTVVDPAFHSASGVVAVISLVARWPRYIPEHCILMRGVGDGMDSITIPEHIEEVEEYIKVAAYHEKTMNRIGVNLQIDTSMDMSDNWDINTSDPLTELRLERRLVRDSKERQGIGRTNVLKNHLPYDQAKEKDEDEIIQAILSGFLPTEPEYQFLIEKAKPRQ